MADQPTPGVHINEKGKKIFIPLENNPEVFTELAHNLGLSSDVGFYDVYSLDEPGLLAMVPRPVHALIFIAPGPVYHQVREQDGVKSITYNGTGEDEPVMWFKQTIGHACGLYSLIHAVGNGSSKPFIKTDSLIDRLLKEALPLERVPRADVLYNSKELEQVHMASAVKGDSKAPSSEEPVGYHFITFSKGNDGHLWELEGSWNPVDRGILDDQEDMLSDRAVELGIRRWLKAAQIQESIEFSIVALATRSADEVAEKTHE